MQCIALRNGHDAAGRRVRKGAIFDLPDTAQPAAWWVKVEAEPEAAPAKPAGKPKAKQEAKSGDEDLA